MINTVKRLSLYAANTAASARLLDILERADRRRPNLLAVLTYHRVDHPRSTPNLYPGIISATPDGFARQMEYVATNCYVVSMAELLEARRSGRSLPPRSVMITFDDAYHDFAEHAWPVLKQLGLHVTLFVATAFPGRHSSRCSELPLDPGDGASAPDKPADAGPGHFERAFWWDRLYHALTYVNGPGFVTTPSGRMPLETDSQRQLAFRRLKEDVKKLPHSEAMCLVDQISEDLKARLSEAHVLSWDELRDLARQGVTLGAHTRTHPLLNRVSLDQARAEAVESLQDLERETGSVLPVFAYPGGAHNEKVAHLLKREGFALAFTTVRGVNDMNDVNPLQLRRINIGMRTTEQIMRAQLLAWWLYYGWKHSHGQHNGETTRGLIHEPIESGPNLKAG